MEGTYGRSAFQQQNNNLQSPIDSNTPTSANQYKTNINRTKTRKWVEARTQNYDGDDWGADEYDDDDDDDDDDRDHVHVQKPSHQASQPPMSPPQSQLPSQSSVTYPTTVPTMSHGAKTPVGQNPLQIQTQQQQPSPTNVSLPMSPETNSPFQSMAPPSTIPREPTPTRMGTSAAVPPIASQASVMNTSVYPSALPQVRVASKSAETPRAVVDQSNETRRFPSQGQKELPAQTQPGLLNKPAGPRPWSEARSESPPASSPGPATKPLPFIRPSDIYKRVEEEKERQRLSQESSRPSMDSASGIRSIGQPDAPVLKSEPATLTSSKKQDQEKPLGTVSGPGGPKYYPSKAQAPSFRSGAAPARDAGKDEDLAEDGEDARRYSSSPKLPDLARMSTFGADFFSNPSAFTAPDAPPMPSFRGIPEQPEQESPPEKKVDSAVSKDDALDQGASSNPTEPVPVIKTSAAPNALGLGPNASQAATSAAVKPAVEEKSEPSPSTAKPKRPSVPGAWLSEISEVSNGTDADATPGFDDLNTAGVLGSSDPRVAAAPIPPAVPAPVTDTGASQVNNRNQENSTTNKIVLDSMQKSGQTPRANSPTLPHLQTGPDTTNKLSDRDLDISTSDNRDPVKPQAIASNSTPTSAGSDIRPTAPLVPRAGGNASQDFVPSSSLQRISTMSTTHDSPVKESDKLRDEIIRTLSPVKASEDFSAMASREPQKPTEPTSSEPVSRKSTYLDDVYDDYWGAEDNPEPDAPDVPKIPESVKVPDTLLPQAETKMAATTQQPQAPVAPPVIVPTTTESIYPAVRPLSPRSAQQSATEPLSASGHRRFSWEASGEPVPATASPALKAGDAPPEPEPKSLAAISSQKPSSPPPVTSAMQSPIDGTGHLSPDPPRPQQGSEAKISNISHSVSQASTITPGALAALEPPSPLSVMSDQHPKTVATAPRQLTITEEKQNLQTVTSPTSSSSSPQLLVHPALADPAAHAPEPSVSSPPPSATVQPASASLNIMSFKQCMAPETASERIERLHETRNKFSMIDSGLDEWIRYMQLDPQHIKTTASLRHDIGLQHVLQNVGTSQGGPAGQQQNAPGGSLGVHGSQSGRMSGNAANFSHSTQQVGAKGKELLFTAGKLGKGLLSKGRSKLRQHAGESRQG